jgi:hypothetical protein
MKDVLSNKRTEHMIKNRYHSLITKNKLHRYDKEGDIAKRLLKELRGDSGPEDGENTAKLLGKGCGEMEEE